LNIIINFLQVETFKKNMSDIIEKMPTAEERSAAYKIQQNWYGLAKNMNNILVSILIDFDELLISGINILE
jgi:hypothetical protein